jgi:ABC-type glycerol-3-phosphate transport system substrate-binding protein
VTFNEQPGVRTTAMFRSWVRGDHEDFAKICDPAVLQWGYSNLDQLFVAGDGVFNIHWPSSAPKYEDEFGDRYGVMTLPWGVRPEDAMYDGYGGAICSSSAWNYTINANSEHKQAAGQVVKALTQPEFLVTHFEIAGNIPPTPAALDTDPVRNTSIGRHVDVIKTELERAMTFPVTPVWAQSMTKAEQNIKAAMKGDMSPQKAMDQTNKAVEQIENNYSG